jgi:hypothetical protein
VSKYLIRDPYGLQVYKSDLLGDTLGHMRDFMDAWIGEMAHGKKITLEEDGKVIATGKIVGEIKRTQ